MRYSRNTTDTAHDRPASEVGGGGSLQPTTASAMPIIKPQRESCRPNEIASTLALHMLSLFIIHIHHTDPASQMFLAPFASHSILLATIPMCSP